MSWRVGVDTGGTFTDVCVLDERTQRITVTKVPSTPDDPSTAVVDGVRHALVRTVGSDERLDEIDYFAHGTTVGTNALLEEKGAAVGLLTTAGFGDLLELGRQKRPKLYDLAAAKAAPFVPRERRLEIHERVLYDGSIEQPLDEAEVRARVADLAELGVEGVVICFLYSYLTPEHEQRAARIVREMLPDAFVSVSHEVMPEFREYERLSTTVANAYIGPKIRAYLSRLEERVAEAGATVMPRVTQSNGAIMSLETARTFPVRTALSGPSTGVVGAAELAGRSGIDRVITFDMGGTSTDVALVNDGRPTASPGMELGGRPIRTAMLDINTVGAGGGSIAWIDEAGHLKVGPRSAGAVPGPACYGQGNTEPTVTDANVVLGVLSSGGLVGGDMTLDPELSFAAVESLGKRLGLDVYETAQGIISVVTANMARAIRVVSVQRGYDPKDYALVAFGGAGPLHAGRLAQELRVGRVLVPESPGALSALGMLMTDLRADLARTTIVTLDPAGMATIAETFAELAERAQEWFTSEGVPPEDRTLRFSLDARYLGQNYELAVDVDEIDAPDFAQRVRSDFEAAHERQHGYSTPDGTIELVTFRAVAEAPSPKPEVVPHFPEGRGELTAIAERRVYFPETGGLVDCSVYDRADLRPGDVITGPAVLEQYDTTSLLLPGQIARLDPHGMLHFTWPSETEGENR